MIYDIIPSSGFSDRDLSFWQSPIWTHILMGSEQAQSTFYFGNIASTYLCIEIRSIGLGWLGAFALGVSASQVGDDWDEYIVALRSYLISRGVIMFQMEPIERLSMAYPLPASRSYKKFLTPYTRIIDLTVSEDMILEQMNEKGRYNIRSAIKKGVTIQKVVPTQEHIDTWMSLLDDTLTRDGFTRNSRVYYDTFLSQSYDEQHMSVDLYFAYLADRVIAAGVLVVTPSRAIYYYGASSSTDADRRVFAPYLLQWEMMRSARERGIPLYDLFGISDPDQVDDHLAGVSFFKSRFGGVVTELPPKMIVSLSWKYRVFRIVQKTKKIIRRGLGK